MLIKRRHPIRNSDIREMKKNLKPELGEEIENLLEGNVERAELETGETIIIINNQPTLVKKEERILPLIFASDKLSLKKITVDMGAVKPISDGADVMAPGIVKVDENIEKEDIVAIEDEKNHKKIAIGTALENASDLKGEAGKVVKNLHYVGDQYWSLREKI